MKKFFKILVILLLVFVLTIVGLVAASYYLRETIAKMAITKAGETLGAPMGVKEVKFSLLDEFPLASIQFEDFWIAAPPADSSKTSLSLDTLAFIQHLYVSVESEPLLNSIFNVREVTLDGGYAKYLVDEDGETNFDFLMAADTIAIEEVDTTNSVMPVVNLDQLVFRNFTCHYKDDLVKAKSTIFIPQIKAFAKIDSLTMYVKSAGDINVSDANYHGTNLDRLKQASLHYDIDYVDDSVKINDIQLLADELSVDANGMVILGDNMYLNMLINTATADLAAMSRFAPDTIFDNYEISELAGALNVKTNISGTIEENGLPHYDVYFNLANAGIKYQSYPSVTNINLKGYATNGRLNNNTTTAVRINQFGLDVSGNHIDIEGNAKNLDSLQYDIKTNLAIDLGASNEIIPDTLMQNAKGSINLVMATKGALSDSITEQFIEDALTHTSFELRLSDINLDADTLHVRGLNAELGYRNREVSLKGFDVNLPDYKVNLVDNGFKVKFSGQVNDPDNMNVDLKSLRLGTLKNKLYGYASVKKIGEPSFNIDMTTDLNLAELKKYVPDTIANDMVGQVVLRLKTNGKIDLDRVEEQIEDIIYDRTSIDLSLSGLTLDMIDTVMNVNNLSGQIKVDPQQISVNNFKFVD